MGKNIVLDNERMSRVKDMMFQKILDKGFKTNVSKNFSGSCLLDMVGGSMESFKERMDAIPNPSQMQAIIKSIMKTVDVKLDNYASKKNYQLYALEADENSTEEEDDKTVFDDADIEIQKGDDPSIDTESFDSSTGSSDALAETVKELFEDLAQKQADEIRNLSKTVLKLEKIKQDEELKSRKEEDGEFIDEVPDEDKEETKKDTEEKTEEGSNPFGDGEEGDEGSNPFGEKSNEPDDTEDSNPFESNGEETKESEGDDPFNEGSSEGEDNSNPFDEPQEDGEASFESLVDYPILTTRIMGSGYKYRPFEGLTKGDIKNYAKYISNEIMGESLKSAYSSESVEELNKEMSKYKQMTGNIIKMMSDTLAVSAVIGLPIDKDRIKYPYL